MCGGGGGGGGSMDLGKKLEMVAYKYNFRVGIDRCFCSTHFKKHAFGKPTSVSFYLILAQSGTYIIAVTEPAAPTSASI